MSSFSLIMVDKQIYLEVIHFSIAIIYFRQGLAAESYAPLLPWPSTFVMNDNMFPPLLVAKLDNLLNPNLKTGDYTDMFKAVLNEVYKYTM